MYSRLKAPEVNEIEKNFFRSNFEKNLCPSQKEVEKQIGISRKENGVIHLRTRDTIKKKVGNMLIKRRKLAKT